MIHVIIGVGAAGITAAKTIRENDPDAAITMISTDEHVHSRCMLHRYLSHERNEDTLSFVEPDFLRLIGFNGETVSLSAPSTPQNRSLFSMITPAVPMTVC